MATTRPGPAIAASFGFLGPAWSRAYGPLLVVVAIGVAQNLAPAVDAGLALPRALLFFLLSLVFGTIQGGALYRVALQADHAADPRYRLGLAGFQWAQIEWRVLGARVLFGILVGCAIFFVLLVWAIALGVLIQGKQIDPDQITSAEGVEVLMRLWRSPAGPVSALILGLGLLGVFYIYARLLLLVIMAAETGDFGLGRALALTRGATAAAMLGALVIFAIGFAVGAAGGVVGGFVRAALAATFHWPGGVGAGGTWGSLVGGALGAAYGGPATVGLVSYIYRRQRGDLQNVAETFS